MAKKLAELIAKKDEAIAELQRKLTEAEAYHIHRLHFFSAELDKFTTKKLAGSAVVITLKVLGGKLSTDPVAISNGLSDDTIAAIRRDLLRSYEERSQFKPKLSAEDAKRTPSA